jgi:KipI family sensor histidine kinase inhibitor
VTIALLPYGDRAWLLGDAPDPIGLADQLRRMLPDGIEVVVGARTCLVRSHQAPLDRAVIARAVDQVALDRQPSDAHAALIVLRVRYDGEDLAGVAEQTGLDPDDVVALHAGATYRVGFLGFAPGFGYLTGLPEQLHLPRRAVPRVRVPAGAVAIADRYTAIYPRSSPGGWHLLGTSGEWLFDTARQPPARLAPGDLVRFEAE